MEGREYANMHVPVCTKEIQAFRPSFQLEIDIVGSQQWDTRDSISLATKFANADLPDRIVAPASSFSFLVGISWPLLLRKRPGRIGWRETTNRLQCIRVCVSFQANVDMIRSSGGCAMIKQVSSLWGEPNFRRPT